MCFVSLGFYTSVSLLILKSLNVYNNVLLHHLVHASPTDEFKITEKHTVLVKAGVLSILDTGEHFQNDKD